MSNTLEESKINRQNILNNHYAIDLAESELQLGGFPYLDELIFTKEQVAKIFNVDTRIIERYVSSHNEELKENRYKVLTGTELKKFKSHVSAFSDPDINIGVKVQMLSIFNIKSVLNLSMLISESKRAKEIRTTMLNIVMDVINKKSCGNTKYINQRD